MKRGAPIDPREIGKLLKAWGFVLLRHSGGHDIYQAPQGGVMPVSRTRISDRQVTHAAHLLGITYHNFLKGPKK
jgi:predicted RNA binding protein YcfA (HicA-like mRNA interferase family)